MIALLLLAQVAPGPADAAMARYERCAGLAQTDPAGARAEATLWQSSGGGTLARQCTALAYAAERDWLAAATAFTNVAREAQTQHDPRAPQYWAQAGNAWLAAGRATEGRRALDTALAAGTLTGLQLGEAQLDHARALVAMGDLPAARIDMDHALVGAAADPLAWLLSATLARRMGDLPRAKADIAEALRRSPDDASVQLEAGNIAALARDEAGARTAWAEAVRIAPDSDAGRGARGALGQFDHQAAR